MKTYSIYTLNNPITNEIKYVGQTCNSLKHRLRQHLTDKAKSYKNNWIKNLLKEDLIPNIILVKDELTKNEANELEKYYIKSYKENGIRLTNMTDGGEGSVGFKHSYETKEKLSELRKKLNTPEHKEYLKICGIKQWENADETTILNNKLNQPNRKTIYQYDLENNLIKSFNSLREIERELGYFRANISPCLKGVFKQAYGFIWKYSDGI